MQRGIFDFSVNIPIPLVRRMWAGDLPLHDWEESNPDQPIPPDVADGTPPDVYNGYRKGRDSACADIVLVTQTPDGWAALLSMRKPAVCYGNKWWHHGGAILSYASVTRFVADRAEKECGVAVTPGALLGTYRTCAGDRIGSTLQLCYAGKVPFDTARQLMSTDSSHSAVRLFTRDGLAQIPVAQRHWYPMLAVGRALESLEE